MKNAKLIRLAGATAAALLAFAPFSAFPVNAAGSMTSKELSVCNYYKELDVEVKRGEPYDTSLAALGVNLSEKVTQIWIKFEMDIESGLPAMPAIGYTSPGHIDPTTGEQNDWYGDGLWLQPPASEGTIVIDIPEEDPLQNEFSVQMWGEKDKTIDKYQLKGIGVVTSGIADIGIRTRTGDLNDDKTVNLADAEALAKWLTEGTEPAAPANGDLDRDNKLTAVDLTLLKRGILDGSFNQTIDSGETAMEFVKHLRLGWNLGNTLDAQIRGAYQNPKQAETAWGNPETTRELIDGVKAAGFNTVRLPVSWGEKMNSNYEIDGAWMDRVQEIVDYVIDNGMYCILNIHHDNGYEINQQFVEPSCPYFYPTNAHWEHSEKFVTAVWTQVSERFKSYGDHLIFETLNEPRMIGHRNQWWIDPNSADCKEAMDCVNKLNAAGLKAIRNSGGNNAKRFVMLPSYAASADQANLDGVVLPEDDHIIASAHAYNPQPFALQVTGTNKWSESNSSDTSAILTAFANLKTRYIDKGIPVIMGEFGAMNKDNDDDRAAWAKYYVSNADKYGIVCVWWDNNYFQAPVNDNSGESFGLMNRNSNTVQFPKVMEALLEATAGRAEN